MRKVHLLLNSPWKNVLQRQAVNLTGKRMISCTAGLNVKEFEPPVNTNPIQRTLKILGKDLKFLKKLIPERFRAQKPQDEIDQDDDNDNRIVTPQSVEFQTHCDILVIGGGGVGSSIAYWLKKKARDGLNVVVVEKDPTYSTASSIQSFHGLSQHFSLPENIQMAMYGSDFLRGAKDHLGDVNINFTPYGSLILATENQAEGLKRMSKTQTELGVRNELLSKEKLAAKFPWLNTEDIVLGCHGLEKEGWFDPLALLLGYNNKAREYGAHFVEGEVVNFEFQLQSDILVDGEESDCYHSLDKAVVQMPDGEVRTIKFAICVIAAGSGSGHVGRLARIGVAPGLLTVPLPVEPRKRYSYIFNNEGQNTPVFSTPLTVDPNGMYFRREGLSGNYLCGRNSTDLCTSAEKNTEAEKIIFENEIRPTLAHRVDAFKNAKVQKSWTDTYEYNTFDENGIIGAHPYYNNLYIAAGFNGHGIQQTPAVGRGVSELIIDGRFRTIDLSRLGFDRLIVDQPLYEVGAV